MEKIRFQKNSDEMMRVISEQKKSLYLKGSVYKDGVWMEGSGRNSGILL